MNLRIQSEEILFKLDTGAQANVLSYYLFQKVGRDDELKNTGVVLNAYGKGKIGPIGKAMLKCEVPSTKEIKQLTFFIII